MNVFQLQKSIAPEVNYAEVHGLNPEVKRQIMVEKCQSYIEITGGTPDLTKQTEEGMLVKLSVKLSAVLEKCRAVAGKARYY